jgi:hypothetical protein
MLGAGIILLGPMLELVGVYFILGRPTSEKDSTCISPFVHPNEHVITCSSSMWPEMHASAEEFTWFL